MVTITIGGNDAGFASDLRACVLPDPIEVQVLAVSLTGGLCGEASDAVFDSIEGVLSELVEVAPNAAVFVLGYPHLTPQPTLNGSGLRCRACRCTATTSAGE